MGLAWPLSLTQPSVPAETDDQVGRKCLADARWDVQLAIERFLERPPAEAPPERTKSSPKPPAAPPPESSSEDEGDGAGIARNWNPPWDHRKEPDFVSRQASADAAAKVLFPLSESMGRKCEQWKELEQMYSTHAAFRADCQDDLEYTVMTVRWPACPWLTHAASADRGCGGAQHGGAVLLRMATEKFVHKPVRDWLQEQQFAPHEIDSIQQRCEQR